MQGRQRGGDKTLRMFGKRKYFTSDNHKCVHVYVHVYINVYVCVEVMSPGMTVLPLKSLTNENSSPGTENFFQVVGQDVQGNTK